MDALETYGFHGEALCNMIHLSDRVEILVRTANEWLKKEFKFKSYESDQYETRICKLDAHAIPQLNSNFTTLIRVTNLFGKYPIRQQQLTTSAHIRSIVTCLQTLALVNYHIEFYLEDISENRVLFHSKRCISMRDQFLNLIGLKSSIESIRHFSHNAKNGGAYQVDGCIYLYSKVGINSNFNFTLTSSLATKFQFVYINKFHVQNTELYDTVAGLLSSCKEFNILNSNAKQTVFCVVIKCPPADFKIVSVGRKSLVEFKSEVISQYVNDLLVEYVREFLSDLGYKKISPVAELAYKEASTCVNTFDYDQRVLVDDLKNTRASRTFKKSLQRIPHTSANNNEYFNKNRLRVLLQNCLRQGKRNAKSVQPSGTVQLVSQAVFNKNKAEFFSENNFRYTKLNYETLIKEMSTLAKRDNLLNAQTKNKATQTHYTSTRTQNSAALKENWIVRKNSQGVEYYVNLVDGSSTYDSKMGRNYCYPQTR